MRGYHHGNQNARPWRTGVSRRFDRRDRSTVDERTVVRSASRAGQRPGNVDVIAMFSILCDPSTHEPLVRLEAAAEGEAPVLLTMAARQDGSSISGMARSDGLCGELGTLMQSRREA